MSFDTPPGTRGARSRAPSGTIGRWVQRRMMNQYRRSWKFMGMDVSFLTTVGRHERPGAGPSARLARFPNGDGSWLIVASAGGAAQNPAWYRNLAAHPDRLRIELRDKTVPVTAEQLSGPARERAWEQIVAAQPRYATYQQKTDRELPVIRLTPTQP